MSTTNRLSFAVAGATVALLSGCAAPVDLAQFTPMRPAASFVSPPPVRQPDLAVNLTRRGPPPAPAPAPVWVAESAHIQATVPFPFGGFASNPAGLDTLVKQVRALSAVRAVTVTGFADSIGSPRDNLRLSLRRALFVKALLIARGVPADKITVVGAGATQFLVSPQSCHGTLRDQAVCQARNRRVQIDVAGTVRVLVPGR